MVAGTNDGTTLVLVHGGGFAASCWDPMLPYLEHPVRAVDLPGRGARPDDLATVTLADSVAAVVEDVEELGDVVLVGHSLAGITLPGVAAAIPERLRRLVFVSCSVPPDGSSVADILATFSPTTARVAATLGDAAVTPSGALHPDLGEAMFCNDMDPAQRKFTLDHMVPEGLGVVLEPVDLTGLVASIPRTYVRLLQDAALSLDTQDGAIANMGGAEVVDLDAGHMAMISRPAELAAVLDALADRP
jgi:pimeloyl-ACP methyl ester carboxylesterase